jgi:hypothetical protein
MIIPAKKENGYCNNHFEEQTTRPISDVCGGAGDEIVESLSQDSTYSQPGHNNTLTVTDCDLLNVSLQRRALWFRWYLCSMLNSGSFPGASRGRVLHRRGY